MLQVWSVIKMIVAVLATLGVGTGGVMAWLAGRQFWLKAFLLRVEQEARNVVLEVEQVYVDRVLAARKEDSPGGSELLPEEQAEALRMAVDRLMELLGIAMIERALRIMKLPTLPGYVRGWLTSKVEAHVKRLSIEQEAAKQSMLFMSPVASSSLVPVK